jgi:medium-chain acyl-[acyl-carrier-protein] hydrolase
MTARGVDAAWARLQREPAVPRLVSGRPRPDADQRLVCFPYAGGGVSVFRGWQAELRQNIEVRIVELPGRGALMRTAPFRRMEPLVEATVSALSPFLDKPLAFFGHSMGALVAFEVARTLALRHGVEPRHLFASAHPAPHLPRAQAPIHDLPEPQFHDELRRRGGTPTEVLNDAEIMRLTSPAVRADFEVCETYRFFPGWPLECPITAFGGDDDRDVTTETLEAWRVHTRAAFNRHSGPGDHFFIHTDRVALVTLVDRALKATEASPPPRPFGSPLGAFSGGL